MPLGWRSIANTLSCFVFDRDDDFDNARFARSEAAGVDRPGGGLLGRRSEVRLDLTLAFTDLELRLLLAIFALLAWMTACFAATAASPPTGAGMRTFSILPRPNRPGRFWEGSVPAESVTLCRATKSSEERSIFCSFGVFWFTKNAPRGVPSSERTLARGLQRFRRPQSRKRTGPIQFSTKSLLNVIELWCGFESVTGINFTKTGAASGYDDRHDEWNLALTALIDPG